MADLNPGDGGADGARLKAYWLVGAGAAKWNTWTSSTATS